MENKLLNYKPKEEELCMCW